MFGVPIDGPANVLCDNHSVVKNMSILELTLMKRHNAINYHLVCFRSGCSTKDYLGWKRRWRDEQC